MKIFTLVTQIDIGLVLQVTVNGEAFLSSLFVAIVIAYLHKSNPLKVRMCGLFWAFFGHRGLRIVSWHARAELS